MSLTEDQIIRYSRQILLAQIGGRGQEKLLVCGAQLVGRGAAQATAAAYLAAGGVPVRAAVQRNARVRSDETGLLFARPEVGQPFALAFAQAASDLNPDALSDATRGLLGEVPADFSGSAPWVALGWRQGRGEVVYRSERGCAECFSGQLDGLTSVPPGPQSVLVGTVGALVFQRLCLGASDDLGLVTTDWEGELQAAPVNHCPRCA